jgi:hypothetical protein
MSVTYPQKQEVESPFKAEDWVEPLGPILDQLENISSRVPVVYEMGNGDYRLRVMNLKYVVEERDPINQKKYQSAFYAECPVKMSQASSRILNFFPAKPKADSTAAQGQSAKKSSARGK